VRCVAAATAAGATALAAALWLAAGGDDAATPRAATSSVSTAKVERRDLVDRETIDGTLTYAGAAPLLASAGGTLTAAPEPGAVVRRGHALYSVDGEPAAWLLYGPLPAWRDFAPGMADGEDVRQLERNLRALGHDPDGEMTVDREWTWATTAAVLRFQDARGLTEDGVLARGEVVFRSGPARVGEVRATVGQALSPGAQIAELSTTEREVIVELEATRQSLAREGDGVTVELPDGRMRRGRIAKVGTVAEQPAGEDAEPTIDVTISLRGRAARGTGFDRAPVDVGFARERRADVLAVPVTALLARAGGGFALEAIEPGGRRRLVPVRTGTFADDRVEVSGSGLREGMRVVTAQ
jgi:peptidoglycan hydrolase-like protein with peptidoglycan-binding domain